MRHLSVLALLLAAGCGPAAIPPSLCPPTGAGMAAGGAGLRHLTLSIDGLD